MPSIFRPDPADIPGTYYDLPSIRANIDELHAQSDHSIVSAVWLDILREQLPVEDFYHIRPEEDTEAGFADLIVHQRTPPVTTGRNRAFFVIQSKGATYERDQHEWQRGVAQLAGYLSGMVGNRRGAARTPAYGAIAVGRYVRFLRWLYEERTVEHWVPGDWSPAYCIGRDCREIQHVLDEILALH